MKTPDRFQQAIDDEHGWWEGGPAVINRRSIDSVDIGGSRVEVSPDGEWPRVTRSNGCGESGLLMSGPNHHDIL